MVTVTLSAGDHTVAIGAIAFTRHNEEGKLVMDHFASDVPPPSPGPKQEPPPGDPPGDALIWVTLGSVGMGGIHSVYTLCHGAMELDIHVVDEHYSGEIYSIEIFPQVQVPAWDAVEGIQAPEGWNFEKAGNGVRFYTETNPMITHQHAKFRFKVNAKRISWYIRIYAANEAHDTIGILLGNRWWLQYVM